MEQQLTYGEDFKFIPVFSLASGVGVEAASDVYCYHVQIVNVCFVGYKNSDRFMLIDAGMPKSAERIIAAARERFGKESRPEAIILTHGHFDHVGAIIELINYWNVPVFAHELELPYLTGEKSYPKGDASVEGGMVAKLSPFFPKEPIQLKGYVHPLPKDGSVPYLPQFRWIHTPGHTPGHISLFRETDRCLIAGDAFVNVKQDSLYKVITQEQEINGPPRYFTMDWKSAKESVKRLYGLKPEIAITGHGYPVTGEELTTGLERLVNHFDELAVPRYGKYIDETYHQ